MRYKLLPYIYTIFWQQHRYGEPILRPISLVEQHIPKNLIREEEFCFGDKILVSPVLNPGQKNKVVYLPEGEWYYYFNLQKYVGLQEHTIDTPLDEMPIFVKGGSIIPEYPVMQYTFQQKIDALKLNVYFSRGKFDSYTYADHGDTFAYEQSVYAEKHFLLEGTDNSLVILQQVEGLYNERFDDYKIYLIGIPFEVRTVKADGVELNLLKDESGNDYIQVEKDFRNLIIT